MSVPARLRAVLDVVGWRAVAEALLHPLLIPFLIIVPWTRSLWAARPLINGQWGRYQGFNTLNALNNLFYKTQWINVDRYGLAGTSPGVGLGEYRLSSWFHLSLLPTYLYGNGGAAVMLLGTLSWVALHAVWFWVIPWDWVLLVTAVLFLSSTTYLMAFVLQNYNIIGWMWLPLALFGTITNQLGLAAIAWFAASLGSITAIFVAVPIVAVLAVTSGNHYLLLALVPALMKIGLHLVPLLQHQNLRTGLGNIAKIIGMTSRRARYRRTSMRIVFADMYVIGLLALGIACIWLDVEEPPALVLTAFAIYLVNQHVMRFADRRSVVIVLVSAAAATVISNYGSMLALLGLVLMVNPFPASFGSLDWRRTRSLVAVTTFPPFDHSRVKAGVEEFFEPVPSGARVLFAFDDPGNDYERIFDGYRVIIELPLLVAAEKSFHLMPDWYAVTETNYPGAPDFWGRSPAKVIENARRWNSDYVIVYQDSGTQLESTWADSFAAVSEFDWADWTGELRQAKLWVADRPPKWWLLRKRTDR